MARGITILLVVLKKGDWPLKRKEEGLDYAIKE